MRSFHWIKSTNASTGAVFRGIAAWNARQCLSLIKKRRCGDSRASIQLWSAVSALLFGFALSASHAAPFAYITNKSANTVSVIDIATKTVTATVPVGMGPEGVGVSLDGTRVYIANRLSADVSVINTASNTVVATVAVGTSPLGVAVTPDGTRVYVANNLGNNVSVIDAASNAVTSTIAVGTGPQGVVVSPNGANVYVANNTSNTVSVINTTTNTVTTTIGVGTSPKGIAVTPGGSRVYVANNGGANDVSVIDTGSNTVIATITLTDPYGVAVTPDGARVYVTNAGRDRVSVISTATHAVVATVLITSSADPEGISITPDGLSAYVAVNNGNHVNVISTASNTVTAIVAVGSSPVAFGSFISLGSPSQSTLTVNVIGSGSITSTPAGIDCGLTCNANFATGSMVTLTATPTSGSSFTGWSGGGCSGTGTCTVTMDAAKTVTANFVLSTFSLTLTKTGSGSGSVVSSPAAIDCGATCTANFSVGSMVTLTATPTAGSTFTGWSGDCSGTGTCTVTMDAAKTVTATFGRVEVTFTVINTNSGGPGSFAGALSTIYNAGTDTCLPGVNTIAFNIPAATDPGCNAATGICSIPILIVPLEQNIRCGDIIIDGYTQPGAAANSATDRTNNAQIKIELGANLTGNIAGAIAIGRATTHPFGNFSANNVTIRGIAFPRHSLLLLTGNSGSIPLGGSGHVVAGNVFGWHADGTPAATPASDGIHLYGGYLSNTTIGGPNPADRNILTNPGSANALCIRADGAANVLFEGNYINIDRNGVPVAAAGMAGIRVWQDNGGNTPASRNNVIRRNVIVTSSSGPAFTGTGGGNTVTENILFGHPANIPGISFFSIASGGTNPQLPPVVNAVTVSATQTQVSGTVTGNAGGTIRLEFFNAGVAYSSNNGRAVDFLSFVDVVMDGSGLGSFNMTLPLSVPHVSVTATRLSTGDTSLFSQYVASVGNPVLTVTTSASPVQFGTPSTFTATVIGSTPTGSVNFKVDGVTISGCASVALASGTAQCTTNFASSGTRAITAEYSGDANNLAGSAALVGGQVVTAVAPGAPILNSIASGPGNATLSFSPPASDGGAAISSYTATCTAAGATTRFASGAAPSITVGGLSAGVTYNCSLMATNGEGMTGSASLFLAVTPAQGNNVNIVPILLLLLE